MLNALGRGACPALFTGLALSLGCDPPVMNTTDAPLIGQDAGPAVVGAPCDATHACGPGLMCETSYPGGYCTLDCTADECPAGSICDGNLTPFLCLDSCAAPSDCRDGYQCWSGACRPPCSDDMPCSDGGVCDGGVCRIDGGGLANGAACTQDAQCTSGVCLAGRGICSIPCASEEECTSFPGFPGCGPATRAGVVGTYCVPGREFGSPAGEPCMTDRNCHSGSCVSGMCNEACTASAACEPGLECGTVAFEAGTFSGCQFPSGASYSVTLPDVTVAAGSRVDVGHVALPPDVLSATLRVRQTGGQPLQMSFDNVTQGSTTFMDLTSIGSGVDVPNRWIPSDSFEDITMLIPNSTADRVTLRGANVFFSVVAFPRTMGDTATLTASPTVLVRRGTDSGSATFDIAVHLVSVGVTAASAPTDGRVQAMLSRMGDLLGAAGLRIGDVRYIDTPSSALSVIDSAEGRDSELAQLFRMSSTVSGRVVSLFLVRGIDTGRGGFNTLGIAGGIPGSVDVHGTMHSGVVLAFDPSVIGPGNAGGRFAGMIASHELSHFLGLYHVTESVRPCAAGEDPSMVACAPFGGGDTLADTAHGDTTNLMNWSVIGSGSNTAISAGQGYVLRRSGQMR